MNVVPPFSRALVILPLSLLVVRLSTSLHADVQVAWSARYENGLPAKSHKPVGIVRDNDGNLVVAGTSTSANNDGDYVLLKYAPNGTLLWSTRYNSTNTFDDQLASFAVDTNGAIAVTGTGGTVKFAATYAGRDVAVDATNVYVTGFSSVDYATVKINAAGSNVWLKTYDKAGLIDHADRVAVDGAGNVFVAGFEQWFQCYPTVGCYGEMAVVKYSPEGNQLWSTVAFKNSSGDGEVKGLVTDALGNVIVSGNYTSGSESGYNTAKINSGGQRLWGKSAYVTDGGGFVGAPGVTAIRLDGEANSYLAGRLPTTQYERTAISATYKFTAAGVQAWETYYDRKYSDPAQDYHRANAIALDGGTNIYVAGMSRIGTATNDFLLIKYNNAGQQQWVERYNGRGNGSDAATGIAVDTNGNVYVTGYATTPEGGTEIVVLKYSEITNIQKKADGAMRLQFFGSPGQSYNFEGTTNFLNWLVLGSSIADSNGIFQFDDTNAPLFSFRFYRYSPP
jgi:hypothetical protein